MTHIIFSFFLFLCALSFGQSEKTFRKVFTEQDGLEIDVIKAMTFDDDGFLWIGGKILDIRTIVLSDKQQCLQRFNGSSFHTIYFPPKLGRVIDVEQIYKRFDGKFYLKLGTQEGAVLTLFDPYDLSFAKIQLPKTPSFNPITSNVFYYNNQEYLLTQIDRIITVNILEKDLSLVPLFTFTHDENKFRLDPTSVFIPKKEYCLIGDDNFPVSIFDWDGTLIHKYSSTSFITERDSYGQKFWIEDVFVKDSIEFVFMKNKRRLHFLDSENHQITPALSSFKDLDYDNVKTYNDVLNNHIIGTLKDENLSLYGLNEVNNLVKKEPNIFLTDVGEVSFASNNLSKELWIGTNNKELHYMGFPANAIKVFLADKQIRAISQLGDKEYLIATEENGWFTLNIDTFSLQPYRLQVDDRELKPSSSRNIIVEDETIWSHSMGNILEIDRETKEVKVYRHYPIKNMIPLTDSTFVYATARYNLMEFNKITKTHRPIFPSDSLIMYDLELQDDLLVVATDKGVLTYDVIQKEISFYDEIEQVTDTYFLTTDYHPEFGFLLGSRAGNIVSFSPKNRNFTVRYKDDLNAGIASLLIQGDTWWINTFNGLVAYNINDSSNVRISENDGLSNNEGNRYSAFDTGNGFLMGAIRGLNLFNPNELMPAKMESSLVLLKMKSYNALTKRIEEVLNRAELDAINSIILPAEYKELQLDFALDQNIENREHSFRYKMNDENWVDINQEQSIRFPNLGAGKYELQIEAIDFSGNIIGTPLRFNINSKNFFYKTWWFYLVLSLVGMGLVLYFLKQAQEKRKFQEIFSEKLLQSQEDERTRIAKDLHDSIGQQLTLIKRRAQEEEQGDISEMTHSALEEVRGISRNLYPSVLKQLGLSESIEQMIYDIDEKTNIFFTAEIEEIDSYFSEDASLNFYRFIQESITNILKHAEASSVFIIIKKRNGKVHVSIKDDGKGFVVSETLKHHSLGLKTIAERIRILKGSFQIFSKLGEGTTIECELSIK